MEEQPERSERRVMTPAVLASALFVAACATFAISFVAARGGLHLVGAETPPPVAIGSAEPTVPPTGLPTPAPLPSPEPTVAPTIEPTPQPTVAPTVHPPRRPSPSRR